MRRSACRRMALAAALAAAWGGPLASARAHAQLPSSAATGQGDAPRERAIRVARDVMRVARFAALITQDPATGATARTIDPAPPDSAMVIRFVTNPASRKVRQLSRDGRVTLYYFDATAMRYATLHGVAREVRDPARKSALWYPAWTPFYPRRELGATLYEVVPRRLEVVSEKDSVVGDPVTWAPPAVRFPQGRPRPTPP